VGRLRSTGEALSDRLGRRGAVLLLAGLLWVVIGVSVPGAPLSPYEPVHESFPMPVRVGLWVLPGVVAVAAAWRPRGAPDGWAYALLIAAPLVRSASWAGTEVQHLWPGGELGYDRGYVSAASWLAVVGFVLITAGWPEAPNQRRGSKRGSDLT